MQKTDLEHIKKVLQHSLLSSTSESDDAKTALALGAVERDLLKIRHPEPPKARLKGINTNQPPEYTAQDLFRRAYANLPQLMLFRRRTAGKIAYIVAREVKRSHFGRMYSVEEGYWQTVRDILGDSDYYKTQKP